MNIYSVELDTGAVVQVDAWSPEDAIAIVEEQASADGYPGIAAVRADLKDESE